MSILCSIYFCIWSNQRVKTFDSFITVISCVRFVLHTIGLDVCRSTYTYEANMIGF